jgi:hypothetical protein
MIEWQPNSENEYPFQLVDSNVAAVTGLGSNFMLEIKLPGASVFADGAGSKLEMELGWYKYISPAAESAAMGIFAISASGTGTTQQNLLGQVGNSTTGLGAIAHTITVEVDAVAISGAEVWITSDEAGNNIVAGTVTTNAQGNANFWLDAGDYYVFIRASGQNFTNPTAISVS